MIVKRFLGFFMLLRDFVYMHKDEVLFLYNLPDIVNKIKLEAKNKNILMKDMLSDCDLGINAISEFSKGKQLSSISLAKIADYLDVSVDYLLGRTDKMEVNK